MAYIIMGKDECNMEFRPDYPSFNSEDEAYAKLGEALNAMQKHVLSGWRC